MSLARFFSSHTTLTPPEWSRPNSAADTERKKTLQERAEDIIYILNHTFTCLTLTDLLIVPILRGFGLNIGHSHGLRPNERMERVWVENSSSPDEGSIPNFKCDDCAPDKPHDSSHKKKGLFTGLPKDPEPPKPNGQWVDRKITIKMPLWQRVKGEVKHAFSHLSWKGAGNWFVGEAVGDVGAALVTIPIQRFFPGVMDGIRHVTEPLVGGVFRHSANRDAKKWGERHQLAPDSEEVVTRAKEIYQYEMRHLPQMLMWTVSSVLLHYGVMRKLEPTITIGEFSRQKAAGAAITAGLIFGVRALAPSAAHKWDSKMGEHVVVPLTKKVGKLFGIDEREVEAHQKRHEENAPMNWQARVREMQPSQPVRSA
jgi:hypothetical protein